MPRVALITEERVVKELAAIPKHNGHNGFGLTKTAVTWSNGAVAVRWNRTQQSQELLKGQSVLEIDFDKLIPSEEEPTSSVGLDVFLTHKVLKIIGAPNGYVRHVGSTYMARYESNWEIGGQNIVQEVDVIIAGVTC